MGWQRRSAGYTYTMCITNVYDVYVYDVYVVWLWVIFYKILMYGVCGIIDNELGVGIIL